ncbi:MAG: hypothetical protein ACREQ7_06620 [Candidatus Binatia bacterium]
MRTTRSRKVVNSTLGELIAAVTDKVAPVVCDQQSTYIAVSYILRDLFAHNRVRLIKRPRRQAAAR